MFPPEYADKKFWRHPPKQSTGDSGPNRIYWAVGKTLSQWEMLEVFMAKLFGTFNGPNAIGASRAYGTLNGTGAKVDALRYSGEPYFAFRGNNQVFKKQLNHALEAYNHAAIKQNDVGHGTVTRFISNNEHRNYGYFLTPPNYASKKISLVPNMDGSSYDYMIGSVSYAFRAKDVLVYHDKFRSMMLEIISFSKELWTTYDDPALRQSADHSR